MTNMTDDDFISSIPDEDLVKSGFDDMDSVLNGGFRRGSVYVFASRPGIGKTTLLLTILLYAHRVAQNAEKQLNPYILCNEYSEAELTDNLAKIIVGQIGIEKAIEFEFNVFPDMTNYHKCFDLEKSLNRVRKSVEESVNPGLMIVDSLSSLKIDNDKTVYENMRYNMTLLKEFAQEYNCAVLVSGGLNRELEKRASKIPLGVHELSEGDAVGHIADCVLTLHIPWDDWNQKEELKNICMVRIHKSRQSRKCGFYLHYNSPKRRFLTIDPRDVERMFK